MNTLLRHIIVLLLLALDLFNLPVAVNGAFSRSAKLFAPDGATSDNFGAGASIYGTNAIISAWYDDAVATNAGIIMYYLIS
jgi:hypothetical protein